MATKRPATSSYRGTRTKSSSGGSSQLNSGFNAQGQAVVRNEFGGWSPVINGVVQPQSTTGPVVGASINVKSGGGGGSSQQSQPGQAPGGGAGPGIPQGTIEAVQKKTGVAGLQQKLQQRVRILQTRQARARPRTFPQEAGKQLREFEIAGTAFAEHTIGAGIGLYGLVKSIPKAPGFILNSLKNPRETGMKIVSAAEATPAAIKRAGKRGGYMLRTSPSEAIGIIGSEILIFKGTGKGLKYTGKLIDQATARANPKFVGALRTGQKITINTAGKGKPITLNVVGRIPRESLKKQVFRGGKKATAVSSQQEPLINLIRRSRTVRKPIPNEEALPKRAKKLLKKIDDKTITRGEIIELDTLIKKRRGKGVLERSFFADPAGRIRPSRLGVVKDQEAGLMDILSGDVTFRRARPQILVFPNVRVQKLPRSLNSIKRKLKSGRALTESEANKLLVWQQKISGKFKPIGFVTQEAEISLAPGEVIKRVKKIGVALIKGKKVPIIQARVTKATKATRRLLSKAQKGTISRQELSRLRRNLKRETGFKIPKSSIEYRGKRISLRRLGASLSSRALSKVRYKSGLSSRARSAARSKPYGSKGYSPKYGRSGVSGGSGRSGVSGASYGRSAAYAKYGGSGGRYARTARGIREARRGEEKKGRLLKFKGKNVGFHVYGKAGKKLIRLTKLPLRKADAKSRGAYAIDHTTSKTFVLAPAGRTNKFGKIKKFERGYINRAGYKFRTYRIRKGRAIAFKKERSIEKRRYGIDTSGEKRQLSLARYARQHGLTSRISAAAGRAYPGRPKYRYVGGGMFGERRRVLIKSKSRPITFNSPRVKPKYRYVQGGMFGPGRRISIRPKSRVRVFRKSHTKSKQKYRNVYQGMFSAPRRVLIKSPARRLRPVGRSRIRRSTRQKYKYVSTGLFGGTRRILVRPRLPRSKVARRKNIRRSRSSIKRKSSRRRSGSLLGSGGFMG